MILTYRYRIKDRSAKKALRRHARACNVVWNYCNEVQRDIEARHRAGEKPRKWPSHFDLQRMTKGTSKELGIHAQTIGAVCEQYVRSRGKVKRSLRFRGSSALGWIPFERRSRQISANTVTYLGKTFRFWEGRRPLPPTAKGGAFVEDARGRWYVCFHVEVADRPTGCGEVGIDLGLKTLASCSDGTSIPALRHYRKYERALAVAQRAGNRKRVKAIHAKIANARRDHIHKATARIAAGNRLIVVGNVNVAQMVRTRMAKSVLDASWALFRSALRYKASRHGATYIEADERWTSQLCSTCGARCGPKGIAQLGIREWTCGECGTVHDRDTNAAKNILALSAQRRADESRVSAY